MSKCTSIEADAILDQTFPVHNHGFVRLVDYLGNDSRIVQAARVSYGSGAKSPDEDRKLIHYLMKNLHTSPFEQVVMTFHIKMPIFVMRQHVRHRTARLNEISGRYSVLKDEFFIPDMEDIRPQSKTNKQGRDENMDIYDGTKTEFVRRLRQDQDLLYRHYDEAIQLGIAKEIARINLPLSTYTELYWQIDAHNLMHFLKLRLHQHAQKEIRVYAEKMFEIFRLVCPVACGAFEEHILYAKTLSRTEWNNIREKVE
jgi:thymidylate synthase (FAD)